MVEIIYKTGEKTIVNKKYLQDVILKYFKQFILTWKFI